MEKRKTPGIYIIVLVIGIFFISLGIVVLWLIHLKNSPKIANY